MEPATTPDLVSVLKKAQAAVRRVDDARRPVSEKELEIDDAIDEALKLCNSIVMKAPGLKGDAAPTGATP